MPTNHSISSAMLGPPLASLTSGPPQRASIPVLALEAQPPTGLPSRPTCRGAGPLQVLKTQGFVGLLPVGRPGPASLQCRPANNRFEGYRDSNPRPFTRNPAFLRLLQPRLQPICTPIVHRFAPLLQQNPAIS